MPPLEQGSSKETISKNIATEMAHGKPQKQAIAIAMREAGVPKPAKDAAGPAHDPKSGQFTSGSGGGSSGKKTESKNTSSKVEDLKERAAATAKAHSDERERLEKLGLKSQERYELLKPFKAEADAANSEYVKSAHGHIKKELDKIIKADQPNRQAAARARSAWKMAKYKAQGGKDEQPAAITHSGMPLYKGRDLDSGAGCDAGIAAPAGCDWPGRVL